MFVTMSDLGQAADKSRQTSWWAWFFGLGPKPAKAYRQVAFQQQQAGATFDTNPIWGDMQFEAARSEDLDVFAEQGYDAAQALAGRPMPRLSGVEQWDVGMSDVAAAIKQPSRVPAIAATALVVGGLGALLYASMRGKDESPAKRRNG